MAAGDRKDSGSFFKDCKSQKGREDVRGKERRGGGEEGKEGRRWRSTGHVGRKVFHKNCWNCWKVPEEFSSSHHKKCKKSLRISRWATAANFFSTYLFVTSSLLCWCARGGKVLLITQSCGRTNSLFLKKARTWYCPVLWKWQGGEKYKPSKLLVCPVIRWGKSPWEWKDILDWKNWILAVCLLGILQSGQFLHSFSGMHFPTWWTVAEGGGGQVTRWGESLGSEELIWGGGSGYCLKLRSVEEWVMRVEITGQPEGSLGDEVIMVMMCKTRAEAYDVT